MNTDGPHLTAALICERVLKEADHVVSAIRIIDRITFATNPAGELMQLAQPISFLLTLKAGAARGSYTVSVHMEKPSGERGQIVSMPVHLEGEDRGVNIVLDSAFQPDQAGLYWYDVYFEDERLTRIPLRAIYQPLPTIGGPVA